MAKKSKLLAALDAHQGRGSAAEKQEKIRKEGEKKKRAKTRASVADIDEESALTGTEKPVATESEVSITNGQAKDFLDETFEAFSGEESNGEGDDNDGWQDLVDEELSADGYDDDDENASDVALSDLSTSDRADTIPHQRLTINNTRALKTSTDRITLTPPSMPFQAHNSLVLTTLPDAPTSIPDPHDDLTRELEFYRLCKTGALEARKQLLAAKVPFTRPPDYFAEMVKSEEQMGRIKTKLHSEAAGKKASEEARRVRDAKKFGKQVQVAKEQERAREKRSTLEKIQSLKRKRKGQDTGAVREGDDLFESIDVEAPSAKRSRGRGDSSSRGRGESSRGRGRSRGDSARGKISRQSRDTKFGFGGRKRFSKSGDAVSSGDLGALDGGGGGGRGRGGRGSGRGRGEGAGRGGGGAGRGAKRLGKSRRVAAR